MVNGKEVHVNEIIFEPGYDSHVQVIVLSLVIIQTLLSLRKKPCFYAFTLTPRVISRAEAKKDGIFRRPNPANFLRKRRGEGEQIKQNPSHF